MGDGDALVFPGLCSESPNIEQAGDLILVIRNTENTTAWVRHGANLVIEVTVSVAESLLGWERTFADHPSGQAIHVVCKRTIREAEQLVIDGKGMPIRGQGQALGHGQGAGAATDGQVR
jgi:DnaJ-class molecular chaperone